MARPISPDVCDITLTESTHGLTVHWPDGHERFFHYVWLRSCCFCEHCGSTYSGTSTLQPCDVPLDIQPQQLYIGQEELSIAWSPDGHRSTYRTDWLRANAYAESDRLQRKHRPTLWNGELSSAPPSVDFQAARGDDQHLLAFLRKLRDYGFVIVKNGPREVGSVEVVAALISEIADAAYGKVFDLNPGKTALTFGNTMNFVPPHTDEAYLYSPPGVNVLHCVRPAEHGGESLLVDGFYLAELLRDNCPEHFETLVTTPQPYHRIVPSDGVFQRMRGCVIKTDETGEVIGFRFHTRSAAPLDVPADDVIRVHAANSELSRLMLDVGNQACFKLEAGDTVFFDNHRVMHARKAFNDPLRHLQIANVSRERFHLRLRFMADKLGYTEEANQVLAAGVAG